MMGVELPLSYLKYMKQEIAQKILQETEIGYDLISKKFSETRKYFWRGLEFIADYTKKGDTVLDFGSGNGRLLELIGDTEDLQYYGVDVSQGLVDAAEKHYAKPNIHFKKSSVSQRSIAFDDNFFNTSYSIAVFHHFPSQKYREEMAKELFRVTKRGGHIVVTVWNLWQKRYIKNIFDNWFNKIYQSFGGSISAAEIKYQGQLDWNDCHISFTDNTGNKFQRFHHAFTKWELRKLFSDVGFEIEKCEIVGGRNILLVAKKK